MKKRTKGSTYQKLRSENVYDVIEELDAIGRKIKHMGQEDFNETILALCSLFYIDLFDRPDLEPAVNRAFQILVATREKAIPLIFHQLKEAELRVQLQLARALGQIGKPAIKPLLKFYSGSFNPYQRTVALYAMGKIRNPEMAKVIPRVLDAMDDSNVEVRDTATRLVGKLVEHLDPKKVSQKVKKKIFNSLIKKLADNHSGVRAKAVRSMGKMAKFGFIGPEEKAVVTKVIRRILGLDEAFNWDRAYVVRAEAEETMKYLN